MNRRSRTRLQWIDLCTESNIRILRAAQRRALISQTGAYRTASWESLCVVAGQTPVDILLQVRKARYQIRKGRNAEIGEVVIESNKKEYKVEIGKEAIRKRQTRWESSERGRTTFVFFPNIQERVGTQWISLSHWCTQILTGHGNFRARLAPLGLVKDSCCCCGTAEDTVQHLTMDCPLFEPQRVAIRELVPTSEWK